jgi:hypothetical protein
MRHLSIGAGLACALAAAPVSAGVFTDDFARCLVTKATDADRGNLSKWMVSILTSDPQVRSMANLTAKQREQIRSDAAKTFQRLAIHDCRSQAIAAVKQEGGHSFFDAFGALGQSTVNQLMSAPAANDELEKLGSAFDKGEMEAFGAEAGLKNSSDAKK